MSINNKILLTITIGLALGSLSLSAQADTNSILAVNNQVGIQLGGQNIHYDEKDSSGALLDSEYGNQPSISLAVSTMGKLIFDKDYFQAQYSYAWGKTDYVGQTMGGSGYGSLRLKSDAKTNDLSIRYGAGFSPSNVMMLTPYMELGAHQWDRNVGGGGPQGYMEHYSHKYFGLGLLTQLSAGDNLVFSGNFMYGRTFDSYLNADIPPATSQSTLGSNYPIYKFGLAADYAFSKAIHGNVGLDVATWKYGISAVNGLGLYEPDSKTRIINMRMGIGYAF
jgi:hypothetical protein